MKKSDWKDTAELIGIAAIVASLVFVGLQMRLEQDIAEAQAYIDSSNGLIELSQLTTENQEIWIKGLDGAELAPVEMAKFEQIARAWYIRKLAQWQRSNRLDAGNPERVVTTFAYELYKHPGLRAHFERYIDGINARESAIGHERPETSFTSTVERQLIEFEALAPPLPQEKPYFIY
jgi:hypothetical protein